MGSFEHYRSCGCIVTLKSTIHAIILFGINRRALLLEFAKLQCLASRQET